MKIRGVEVKSHTESDNPAKTLMGEIRAKSMIHGLATVSNPNGDQYFLTNKIILIKFELFFKM